MRLQFRFCVVVAQYPCRHCLPGEDGRQVPFTIESKSTSLEVVRERTFRVTSRNRPQNRTPMALHMGTGSYRLHR
jgi:hypothetical protein